MDDFKINCGYSNYRNYYFEVNSETSIIKIFVNQAKFYERYRVKSNK